MEDKTESNELIRETFDKIKNAFQSTVINYEVSMILEVITPEVILTKTQELELVKKEPQIIQHMFLEAIFREQLEPHYLSQDKFLRDNIEKYAAVILNGDERLKFDQKIYDSYRNTQVLRLRSHNHTLHTLIELNGGKNPQAIKNSSDFTKNMYLKAIKETAPTKKDFIEQQNKMFLAAYVNPLPENTKRTFDPIEETYEIFQEKDEEENLAILAQKIYDTNDNSFLDLRSQRFL